MLIERRNNENIFYLQYSVLDGLLQGKRQPSINLYKNYSKRQTATISLKRKVLISDWDIHKNRARGTNQKSRTLNSYLNKIYNREKTTKIIRIPLLPKALQIIKKYKGNRKSIAQGSIFPRISNQKLNSYIKEIGDI